MMKVCRRTTFNAAHRLFRSDWSDEKNNAVFGKCNNPNFHGHNYTLEVWVEGEIDPETGYLVDLKLVKEMIKNGTDLNSDNELLIVIKFNLLGVKEIYDRIEGSYISNESASIYNTLKKDTETLFETNEKLEYSLDLFFSNFKKGFGFLLVAFIISIVSGIFLYISFDKLNTNDINILLFLSFCTVVLSFIGILILFNSSKLKSNNG